MESSLPMERIAEKLNIPLDDLLKKGAEAEAMRGLDRLNILDIVLGIKGLIEGVVDYS